MDHDGANGPSGGNYTELFSSLSRNLFAKGRNGTPPAPSRNGYEAVIADSESSPPSSPISTRQSKRLLSGFDSPHTPRALVRRLSQGMSWKNKKI